MASFGLQVGIERSSESVCFEEEKRVPEEGQLVLIVGFDAIEADGLCHHLGSDFRVVLSSTHQKVFSESTCEQAQALFLGPHCDFPAWVSRLKPLCENKDRKLPIILVVGAQQNFPLFLPFLQINRLFYISRHPLPFDLLQSICSAALADYRDLSNARTALSQEFEARCRAFSHVIASSEDLRFIAAKALIRLEEWFDAPRVYLWIWDETKGVIWMPYSLYGKEYVEPAAAGLVGYTTRTGQPLRIDHASSDPRYERGLDQPDDREPNFRFLAVPIFGVDHRLLAVLHLVRHPNQPIFSEETRQAVAYFGQYLTIHLDRLLISGDGMLPQDRVPKGLSHEVFRPEAIDAYIKGDAIQSEVLRNQPAWTKWLLVPFMLAIAALVMVLFFSKKQQVILGQGIVTENAGNVSQRNLRMVVFMPENSREWLRPGHILWLKQGVGTVVPLPLTVESIREDIVGPDYAHRTLPEPLRGILSLRGGQVVIEASLEIDSEIPLDPTALYKGFHGPVIDKRDPERLIFVLIPGLKHIWGGDP